MQNFPRSPVANLVGGTLTRYLLLGLNIGVGLYLMPLTVAHLGKAQYGLWMLVASLTYYFSLLDLGYDSGVVRHIVEADARGDVTGVNRIVSTFVCVYTAVGLAACGVTAVLIAFVVPRFPQLSAADVATAQAILAILGLRIAIGFPMTVFGAVTTARQGFVLNNGVAMALVVMNAIITYVVLTSGGQIVALVWWTTLGSIAGYAAYAWTAWHTFPALSIRPAYFSRRLWRDVTTFSVYLFVIDIASQITFNVDNVLIGAFLGTSAVAVYAVAVRLSDYQRRLCDQFSGMLFPVVVGIHASSEPDRLRAALVEGSRVAMALVTGVTICLVAYSRPLIVSWMGTGFAGSVTPFIVLAIVGVVMVGSATPSSILLATGGHRIVAAVWAAEAAANFALSIVLVRRFGSTGVAVGTAVPIVLGHFGILVPAACRRVGLPLREYLRQSLRPAIIGGGPTAMLCTAMRIALPPSTSFGVVLQAAGAGLAYVAIVVLVGFDAATRRRYLAPLRAIVRQAGAPPAVDVVLAGPTPGVSSRPGGSP